MQEWKIRQEIYHRMTTEYDDDLKTKDVVISDDIVDNAIRYFNDRNIGWIYPAKSYMVAILYSKWLSEHFGGKLLDYLVDPDLLHGNDPYYKTYNEAKDLYDEIFSKIDVYNYDESKGLIPDVRKYFEEEFMINDNA